MAFLKNTILLAVFVGSWHARAAAQVSAHDIATAYQNQNWPTFFAQSYHYRSRLKDKIQSDMKQINAQDFSVLILESLAYLRHCQFAMAKNSIRALEVIFKSTPALRPTDNGDLNYLRELLQSETKRHGAIAQENLARQKTIDEETKKNLWGVPAEQKSTFVKRLSQTPTLIVKVQNFCQSSGAKP